MDYCLILHGGNILGKDKFPVMLVSPMKEIHRINFPCIAQTKMDGMRAIIVVRDEEVTVYSRNGKKLLGLEKHFKEIVFHNNMVYDGELTVVDSEDEGIVLDRKAGNGICHKAVESVNTISDEEVERIRITLWDIIPLKAFEEGHDPTPYHLRLGELKSMPKTGLHRIVETHDINDRDEAQELFNKMLAQGEEGIILKNDDHPWENKRSKHCVKMKAELEMDLEITGVVEGQGKNAGMAGALQCKSSDGNIVVDVGTGMDDATRINLWESKDELIGGIVAVKYNEVIQAKSNKPASLFLPVFVELRIDKEEAD